MSATYFWKDGEVITVNNTVMAWDAEKGNLENLYCVDTFSRDYAMRYGKFMPKEAWKHFPLDSFPKEFRAWLLINT